MMPNLTALRVKIGLRPNGHADHPDFNTLAVVIASGLDWSKYVDSQGLGWHYDKTSGHKDDDAGSPIGEQGGMLVVPETFADEALVAFPALCTRLTEAQCTSFYDTKAHAHEEAEKRDDSVISGLRQELELVKETLSDPNLPDPSAARTRLENRLAVLRLRLRTALDPDDPAPGVRKNMRRRWVDMKARAGVTYVEPA